MGGMINRLLVSCAALVLACCSDSSAPRQAPSKFRVQFQTSNGDFVVDVMREWSPLGADHFYELVKANFFDGCRFFRIVPGFVVQFGLKGNPAVDAEWEKKVILDDPPGMSNLPATVSFATRGPQSRTTQVFINLGNNARLDSMGFTPFGRVTDGMQVVAGFYSGYGERPDQNRLKSEGNGYLQASFPLLDYVKKATIVP